MYSNGLERQLNFECYLLVCKQQIQSVFLFTMPGSKATGLTSSSNHFTASQTLWGFEKTPLKSAILHTALWVPIMAIRVPENCLCRNPQLGVPVKEINCLLVNFVTVEWMVVDQIMADYSLSIAQYQLLKITFFLLKYSCGTACTLRDHLLPVVLHE